MLLSIFLRALLLRTAFQGRPPAWEGERRRNGAGPAVRGAAWGKERASGVRGRGGRPARELINAMLLHYQCILCQLVIPGTQLCKLRDAFVILLCYLVSMAHRFFLSLRLGIMSGGVTHLPPPR